MKEVYTLADLQTGTGLAAEKIRLGVLGDPVAHSLSPPMQNAALAACGLEMSYARFRILPNELAEALQRFAELEFVGVNLTVPHKVAALSLVEPADEFASTVGAINTIRFAKGNLVGANTDGPGFARAIRESFAVELRDLRVLVLGAGGGAGQAVVAQCAVEGSAALILANRDFAKAKMLARRWPNATPVRWEEESLSVALAKSDLVVNATALGLQPNDPSPLLSRQLSSRHLVYDLNFQPSALLAAAGAAGARCASGLTMLLHQGALAFEFWFDQLAPLPVMRSALSL